MPDPKAKPKLKVPNKPTAVQKLKLSRLANSGQMEALGGDVGLTEFMLQMRNKAGVSIISEITDATIDRTIEGASTLTVTIDDAYKEVMNSGRLGRRVDVNLDGLWFTLVAVNKAQRQLTLTFEEREVNVLRYYNTFLMADRHLMTRAQFVLKMIQEVKEFTLEWIIPELDVPQRITDARQPNQVVVDSRGNPTTPLAGTPDATAAALSRTGGIYTGVKGLTVDKSPATNEQIGNANIIIATGINMGVNKKVLTSSIMTAIDESRLRNLSHAKSDPTPGTTSSGVFQQQSYINGKRTSWPASGDVATDAAGYFKVAIQVDKASPNLSLNDLCQNVQNSGTPYAYGAFENDAKKILDAYGVAGADPTAATGTTAGQTSNNQKQTSKSVQDASTVTSGSFFTRGTLSVRSATSTEMVLTKEDSWTCMQRLAGEVGWVCFVISGTVYFVSEQWLFKSKAFMSISEESDGIDWIDFDYDEGKRQATVTVSCHLSRWSAPPGSIVLMHDSGIVNGRWLVTNVSRSLFDSKGTITLKKPRPILPEPTSLSNLPSDFHGTDAASITGATDPNQGVIGTNLPMNDIQKQIIGYAEGQLGVPYKWGAESPGVAFDCSGLTKAAYATVGIVLPHFTVDQYKLGPLRMGPLQPADLVHFGASVDTLHHVGIYVGNNKMIHAPHTGDVVKVSNLNIEPDFFAATCPWEKASGSTTQSSKDKHQHGGNNG